MHSERYMRNKKIQLNLLRYDIQWVISRWGFIGKESCCKYFEFVAKLFQEDEDVKTALKSSKKSGSKKQKEEIVAKVEPEVSAEPTLPSHQEESVVAKTDADKVAEDERKELL